MAVGYNSASFHEIWHKGVFLQAFFLFTLLINMFDVSLKFNGWTLKKMMDTIGN